MGLLELSQEGDNRAGYILNMVLPTYVNSLLPTLLLLGACSSSAPEQPWKGIGETQRWTVGGRFPVGVQYRLEGDFTGQNLATMEFVTETDGAPLKGKFGLGLKAECWWSRDWSSTFAVDGRLFDVNGLSPFGADLPIVVDTIEVAQVGVGLRRYFAQSDVDARFRPWIGCEIALLPGVKSEVELDLSGFGSSNVEISSTGEPFYVGALQLGIAGHLTERTHFEVSLAYEEGLMPLKSDLSFEIVGETVPISAEYQLSGWILGWGISWLL